MSIKSYVFAPIPEFNRTQAVFQLEPEDRGDYTFVGVEVVDLPEVEEEEGMEL